MSICGKTGWRDERTGARYIGEWMRLSVHNIHGLPADDWYLTCNDLCLDTIRLKAKTLADARVEAVRIAWRMSTNYRCDLVEARRAAEGERASQSNSEGK